MKQKGWIHSLVSVGLAACFAVTVSAETQTLQAGRFELAQFEIPCRTAILIDQNSGTILYEKQADQQVPIASITKVMTLLLTMEALEQGQVSLDQVVPVSDHAYNMGGSQIWLEPGEQLTLDEMIRAICISSANDAAVAVAEFIGGSEDAFVEKMNAKAAELGMDSTHFENACGLDASGHLSTARDVARMSREILNKYPKILEYTGIWMDTLRGGQTHLINTNKLLKRYEGITGLKTGTTSGAGVCLSASATRGDLSLIAVVLGSPSSAERFKAATTLLDYGFANFEQAKLELPSSRPSELTVEQGNQETVTLQYPELEGVLVKKGDTQPVEVTLDLPQSIEAPVEQGQTLGTVNVSHGGQNLGQWPIVAAKKEQKLTFKVVLLRLWEKVLEP